GSSLRLGLEAAEGERAVVLLVDTPGVTSASVRAVLAIDAPIVAATYEGDRRHPVAIRRELWSDVAAAAGGDRGAGPYLRAHPDLVVDIECAGEPDDIDTPDDLARWSESHVG
ncbi:MAG: NTP transferase domain-containing protein, partial [Actinobacteria bacterium]|nr:NTP transferase domain-containing protein [Actinomycetota bacterium]